MTLLKWLFHRNIDPERLRSEIGELVDLFKEYILFFEQKKTAVRTFYDKQKIRVLKPEIERLNKTLSWQLRRERNEEKILHIITSSNVLTPREKKKTGIVEEKLKILKAILEKQLELYEKLSQLISNYDEIEKEDPLGLSSDIKIIRRSIEQVIDNIKILIKQEEKLLFGERRILEEIRKDILENIEFPVINSVECPATSTIILAQRNLSLFNMERLQVGHILEIPAEVSCNNYKLVLYPGSLDDIIILFCFPNAEIYILQDPEDALESVYNNLEILNRTNIIQNLRRNNNEFIFTFNRQNKVLKAYYGVRGYSNRYVPPEIRQYGIDVVMTKALSITNEERTEILENIMPFIKRGGFVYYELLNYQDREGFVKVHRYWYQKPINLYIT